MDYRKMKNKVHGSNGGQATCAQLSCDDPQVHDLYECLLGTSDSENFIILRVWHKMLNGLCKSKTSSYKNRFLKY